MSRRRRSEKQGGETVYRDNKGSLVYVAKHGDFWITVIETESGVKRFTTKNLPARDTEWEAQADLHKFAKKRKWAMVDE